MDVCVPTGNFGNILGAYYARLIGVPIGRLLCASNANNVLTDFIATGTYDISDRDFVTTPSPSMDILISSNLERLLFHLAGPEAVRAWMAELAENRRFQVDRETFGSLRELLVAEWVSNDECLGVIRRVWDETGYLLDPHTAVAWEVAERLRGENPLLVVATAHWAKFGVDVHRALSGLGYDDPLPPASAALGGLGLLRAVSEATSGLPIPGGLARLDQLEERFSDVVDSGRDAVEGAVSGWLLRNG
jgi:threonine synthase